MPQTPLPYFDFIFSEMAKENTILTKSFGNHVHWGYWEDPTQSLGGDEEFWEASENLTDKFCRDARIDDGQRILDVGCGFGGTIAWINQRHQRVSLHGLNLDYRQLERAQSSVQPRTSNRIEWVNGNAVTLPYADSSFDRVLALECAFHFSSRKKFLSEVQRVLKPGGLLFLSDFVCASLVTLHCALLRLPFLERNNFFGRFNFISIRRYRAYAQQLGFRMQEEDISRHTLPTYPYLKSMVRRFPLADFYQSYAIPGILSLQWATIMRLLTYRLIMLEKER